MTKTARFITTQWLVEAGIYNKKTTQIVRNNHALWIFLLDTELIDLYQYGTTDIYGLTICAPLKNTSVDTFYGAYCTDIIPTLTSKLKNKDSNYL